MLVFALTGDITARERRGLSENTWGISAIVLWELAKLAQLGRIDIDLDDSEVVRRLAALHVWALDLVVSRQSTALDFQSDPADRPSGASAPFER